MYTYIIISAIVLFVLFICFGLAVASYSSQELMDKYNLYDKELGIYNVTALEFANSVNALRFNHGLTIESIPGQLTDKYSPSRKTVFISENNITSPSVSALTVTAHELGHAVKHFNNSKIYSNYLKVWRVGKAVGFMMLPLFLIGIVLMFFKGAFFIGGLVSISLSILLFILAIILKYLNIKVEKEASKFGIEMLAEVLDKEQLKMATKLLNKAKLTYWGELFRVILSWTFLTRRTKMF